MRSVLAVGLLVTLCASADAAAVHHSKPRHFIVRPSRDVVVPPRVVQVSRLSAHTSGAE